MLEEYYNIIVIGLSLSLGAIAYYVIWKASKEGTNDTNTN